MVRFLAGIGPILAIMLLLSPIAGAQETQPETAPESAATAADQAATAAAETGPITRAAAEGEVVTLWQMMQSGGVILWVIVGLSVLTAIMAIYFIMTITVSREAPRTLLDRARRQLEEGEIRSVYQMIEGRDELLAKVMRAGLKVAGHDRYVIQEAMESEGERGATALWQRISYLSNVGMIAPLLGLLGTVWGMIQAFGSIALDNSQVKDLRMAESVAQAMITTAGGLVLAIPALVIYFYLRGQVIKIIAEVEAEATELVELMAREGES
jgi:biopolymer transport protein ExbB